MLCKKNSAKGKLKLAAAPPALSFRFLLTTEQEMLAAAFCWFASVLQKLHDKLT